MKLTKRQKYDYRDIDRTELLLIKVGHHVWKLYKRTLGVDGVAAKAYLAACEDIWEAKRKHRLELKHKRTLEFQKWRGGSDFC